jgi:CheY-like chemotaxis protein
MNTQSQSNVGGDNGSKPTESTQLDEEPKEPRNDFMAQLGQELRAPLNAIMGFAQHLERQCDDASTTDNIKQVQKAANDLLDIINRKLADPGSERDGVPNVTADSQCDVLYIEDDSINFASVKLLLGNTRKLKVVQSTSGKSGLALAQTHDPKLILLDLDLPDIHGSEVITHLQKEPATARIPIIVLSGDTTPSQIERMLVLGARNYVTKPFKVPAFLAVVDEVLEETIRSN